MYCTRGDKTILFILIFMLVLSLVVTGCSKGEESEAPPPEEEEPGEEQEPEKTGFLAPLTGELVEDEELTRRRPVAVMIDNDPTFGAHSGLDKAAWVFEIPVEGGITRFLAVYQHRDAPVLGPVRSTRSYFLDRALEFQAAVSHAGYSPQAKQDIPRLGIISLNEFALSHLYWRTSDKKMPHNLYTNTEDLFAELEERGLNKITPSWDISFFPEAEPEAVPGEPATKIRIHYHTGVVEYRYSPVQGAYKRYFRGQPHEDAETGEQLLITNLIIQQTDRPRVLDSEGRLELKTVGTGSARVFQLGRNYEAVWEKKTREGWTRFSDSGGNTIKLVPGNTWVQVVPEGTRLEIE
ncbi:MAG: DUF3048 domain-containing protein [bacterium]